MKQISRKWLYLFLIGLAFGCEMPLKDKAKSDPFERQLDMTRDEIRDTIRPMSNNKEDFRTDDKEFLMAPTPPIEPIIMPPAPPKIKSDKTVTLSVTEDIEVKDVLLEIARLADLELSMDSGITGGVILSVKERPVGDVVEMIARQAKLRYALEDGVLRVMKDDPYLVNYKVDFINLVRSSTGSIKTQTQVLSAGNTDSSGSGSSSSGLNSGSSNTIDTKYDGDFWGSIATNIQAIIGVENLAKATDIAATTTTTVNKGAASGGSDKVIKHYYSFNQQAGIISVMTDSIKQAAIAGYLEKLRVNMSAQVLIEAKVIEVQLNEAYQTGIDWRAYGKGVANNPSSVLDIFGNGDIADSTQNNFAINIIRNRRDSPSTPGLSIAAKLVETFGTVRTISNPRISALNNQQAVLTFADNQPYYTISSQLQQSNSTGTTTQNPILSINSTLHTIPIGVILALQPSINLETQEITINIRPTISRSVGTIQDPAVNILAANIQASGGSSATIPPSLVPDIEVRELDTVLKIRNGDIIVIGGLIQNNDTNTDNGIPWFGRIPILGNVFKNVTKTSNVSETVIFLQARIMDPSGGYHPYDRKVYETFSQDPRPLNFQKQ